MAPQKTMQPYEQAAYDFCDALDRISEQGRNGQAWAERLASQAITSALAYFPKTVTATLGATEVARHKSAAGQLPVKLKAADVFDTYAQQIAQAARARAGQLGGDVSAVEAQLDQFLQALQAPDVIQQVARRTMPELYKESK